jgi:hypothetical protein
MRAFEKRGITVASNSERRANNFVAAARIGQRQPTIIHVVDICEGGLGFDGMLIVGAVADNFETIRPGETNVPSLLRLLQKQIRYGLPSDNPIRFYEMGFADRAIAQSLMLLTTV